MTIATPTVRKSLVAVAAAGLFASMLVAPPAIASPALSAGDHAVFSDLGGVQAADLQAGLALIDEIPESVLAAGDAALGGAAAALGAELLGIAAVKQKCFS